MHVGKGLRIGTCARQSEKLFEPGKGDTKAKRKVVLR
jgi:hypothetical protein